MSILRSKHSGWTWEGRRTPFGGSGGGGGPSQTTAYQTNLPEYARPYVENMLGATQGQLFETKKVGATPDTQRQIGTDEEGRPIFETMKGEEGRTEITGFKPYQAYSQNVNDYFAGFSPMQQQSFRGMAGMQPASQLGTATDMAGIAGLGSLGAGAQFARQATDPYAMQAYMSPYMQNVVDFQKQAAVRDYGIAMPKLQAQAVGQGAFGGNRMALQQAEAQRGLMSQLQGIQATGTQKAFEDAQRQQQFGAQLGLQGYGQALQGAGQLGQLGQTQYGQQMGILEGLNKFGGQQQQLEQQKINQAIQDYATAQQYPMLQLGFMSNMLRGLPMQAQSTQMYQAQPSALQQGIGLTGAASTLLGGRAAGGAIKEYREGGITQSYANRGIVQANPDSEAVGDIQSQLASMDIEELKRVAATTQSEQIRKMASELIAQKQMAEQIQQQNQNARMSGIALAGGPAFQNQGMAGGGIVAFSNGGVGMTDPEFGGGEQSVDARKPRTIEELFREYPGLEGNVGRLQLADYVEGRSAPPESARAKPAPVTASPAAAPKPETKPPTAQTGGAPIDRGIAALTGRKSLEQEMAEQERLMGPNTVNEGLNAKIAERLAGMSKREKQDELAAIRQAFVRLGTEASPGGFLQAATKSIGTYGEASDAAKKAREGMDLELTKMQADIKKAERAEKRGNLDAAAKSYENAENRQLRIAEMQNQLKVAGMQLNKPGEFEKMFAMFEKDPAKFEQFIAAKDTNRGNLAAATKNILQAKYPEYAMTAMIPPEKRTKQQNEYLQNAYKDAEATARDMMRKGTSASSGKASGEVDTKNPLLGP
jgi:hypothetical protein